MQEEVTASGKYVWQTNPFLKGTEIQAVV
jgi:hypothetical protein